MGGGLIWTYRKGAQSPSGKGLKGGGIPPIPPLLEGSNGGHGKARNQEYKTWDRSPFTFVCSWSWFKMADSLPVLSDDDVYLPVLPDDVLLIIAREYRLATAEDRALDGWWRVHAEMRQLPRCPKRKRIINLKGFNIPRHGNLLEPVTGYFWRRLIRKVFAANADPRLYQWFRRVFSHDDYLRATQAAEWPYIHCHHCDTVHECGNEEEEEERQYQKDQRAF